VSSVGSGPRGRPVLYADSVAKRYGDRHVLRAATIGVHGGRVTALLGRNGCGKTTLLRVIAGEVRPDGGVVHFAGRAWRRPRLHELARAGLFYLPQRGLLTPWRSLRQHLAAVAWHFRGAAVGQAVERLGMTALLDVPTIELSGGERRRAELAVALARGSACLLADEPFAGLAPVDADAVGSVLRELADGGGAVLATGHEVPSLMGVADEIVWMTAGTTHALGDPAAAAVHDQFRREYLGPPMPWSRA
jgi:lipopolysaccharide export system ATP-binding protein